MDVLFTVNFLRPVWKKLGVVQLQENTCDPWRMVWEFWTFFSCQEDAGGGIWGLLPDSFQNTNLHHPNAKTCNFGRSTNLRIFLNLEQTNLDISWGHQWIRRPKEVITFTHLHLLSQQETECLFQLLKVKPLPNKGRCNRKPKPSINETSQIWCNSPSWWKKYAGKRMSTGLRRKTSRQSHWKIAVTAMGFFLAMFFFRFPVSFVWFGATCFSCGEGVCVWNL